MVFSRGSPWASVVNVAEIRALTRGAVDGNWDAAQLMADENSNPQIQFFKVPGHDHFSVIAPLTEMLAEQIVQGEVNVTQQDVQGLR